MKRSVPISLELHNQALAYLFDAVNELKNDASKVEEVLACSIFLVSQECRA